MLLRSILEYRVRCSLIELARCLKPVVFLTNCTIVHKRLHDTGKFVCGM